MPKTVHRTLPADGESLFNTEEKLFPDIKAEPGQKAFVFIHSVPYEGSVLLVNLLTSTRLVRKGFDGRTQFDFVVLGASDCSSRQTCHFRELSVCFARAKAR